MHRPIVGGWGALGGRSADRRIGRVPILKGRPRRCWETPHTRFQDEAIRAKYKLQRGKNKLWTSSYLIGEDAEETMG